MVELLKLPIHSFSRRNLRTTLGSLDYLNLNHLLDGTLNILFGHRSNKRNQLQV